MKVYKLRLDSNNYQRFLLEDEGVWKTKRLTMIALVSCQAGIRLWFMSLIQLLREGSFFIFGPGPL